MAFRAGWVERLRDPTPFLRCSAGGDAGGCGMIVFLE